MNKMASIVLFSLLLFPQVFCTLTNEDNETSSAFKSAPEVALVPVASPKATNEMTDAQVKALTPAQIKESRLEDNDLPVYQTKAMFDDEFVKSGTDVGAGLGAVAGAGAGLTTGILFMPAASLHAAILGGLIGAGIGHEIGYLITTGMKNVATDNKYDAIVKNNKPIAYFKTAMDQLKKTTTTNYSDVLTILTTLSNKLSDLPDGSYFKAWRRGSERIYDYPEVCSFYLASMACLLATLDDITYAGKKKAYKALTPHLNDQQVLTIRKTLLKILDISDDMKFLTNKQKELSPTSVNNLNDMHQKFRIFAEAFKFNKQNRIASIYNRIEDVTEDICSFGDSNFKDLRSTLDELTGDIDLMLDKEDKDPIDEADVCYLFKGVLTLVQKVKADLNKVNNPSFFTRIKSLFKTNVTENEFNQIQRKLNELIAMTLENKNLIPEKTTPSVTKLLTELIKTLKANVNGFSIKDTAQPESTKTPSVEKNQK